MHSSRFSCLFLEKCKLQCEANRTSLNCVTAPRDAVPSLIPPGERCSSPPPQTFPQKIWSLVADALEVPVCIPHLDTGAPQSCSGRRLHLWQTSFPHYSFPCPRANSKVIFLNLKWLIQSIVLRNNGQYFPYYQRILKFLKKNKIIKSHAHINLCTFSVVQQTSV